MVMNISNTKKFQSNLKWKINPFCSGCANVFPDKTSTGRIDGIEVI